MPSSSNVIASISKSRAELMGIAIIGVLIQHFIGFSATPANSILKIATIIFNKIAFTEGFLFLSGFGLYYSFTKDNSIKNFFLKRFKRLVIPFIILSFWFYLYHDIIMSTNIVDFIGHISSLSFWFDGNYDGMWYIAISVFLYAVFPFLYKFIFVNKWGGVNTLFVIITIIVINMIIQYTAPQYFQKIAIGTIKIPMFVIGIWVGYLSQRGNTRDIINYAAITLILFVSIFFLKRNFEGMFVEYYTMVEKLVYIPVVSILLTYIHKSTLFNWLNKILKWFGKYTLELYVLHLLLYSFLTYCITLDLPSLHKAYLTMLLSLALCAPIHLIIDHILKMKFMNKRT